MITNDLTVDVERCLSNPAHYAEAVEHNCEVGRKHFSYDVLRERVLPVVAGFG